MTMVYLSVPGLSSFLLFMLVVPLVRCRSAEHQNQKQNTRTGMVKGLIRAHHITFQSIERDVFKFV
jgi:hypothetical protein